MEVTPRMTSSSVKRSSSGIFDLRTYSGLSAQDQATMHAQKLATRRRFGDDGQEVVMQAEASRKSGVPDGVDMSAFTGKVDSLRRDLLEECQVLNLKMDQMTSHLDTRFAHWLDDVQEQMLDSSWLQASERIDACFAKWLEKFQEQMVDSSWLHNKMHFYQPDIANSPGLRCTAQKGASLFHSFEKMPSQQITPKECDTDLSLPPKPLGLSIEERQGKLAEVGVIEEKQGKPADVRVCRGCSTSVVPNHTFCWKCGMLLNVAMEAGRPDPLSSPPGSRSTTTMKQSGLLRSQTQDSSLKIQSSLASSRRITAKSSSASSLPHPVKSGMDGSAGSRRVNASASSAGTLISVVQLGSLRSKGSAAAAEELRRALNLRTRNRGRFAQAVWMYLEDPQLMLGGVALGRIISVIALASCCLAIMQTLEQPPLGHLSEAILEYVFDVLLSVEIIVRFMVCPNRFYFWTQGHNLIDLVNGPLILSARAILLFTFSEDDGPRRTAVNVLNSSLPVLRLLGLLRRFDGAHLIYKSIQLASEALPELLYVLAVILTTFASILYAVEPRDNIASLPEACWLTIVTLGTVGYGDVYPVTAVGKAAVCILIMVAALYMAMPIGVVGKIFAEVWDDRSRILATQLARRRFKAMGYTSKDIPSMFLYFDWDNDGRLSVSEFAEMMRQMQFDISGQRATELFHIFDADGDGHIEDREFLGTLFPDSVIEIYGRLDEDDDFTAADKHSL